MSRFSGFTDIRSRCFHLFVLDMDRRGGMQLLLYFLLSRSGDTAGKSQAHGTDVAADDHDDDEENGDVCNDQL